MRIAISSYFLLLTSPTDNARLTPTGTQSETGASRSIIVKRHKVFSPSPIEILDACVEQLQHEAATGNKSMFAIIGMLVVLAAVIGGFLMEHGPMRVLMQPSELLIIAGASGRVP